MPIDRRMKYEQNRLDSFDSGWIDFYQLDFTVAQRLAKAGFYCWDLGHTECFSCGLSKNSTFWRKRHNPETVHREERPDCLFVNGQSDNVPITVEQRNKSKYVTKRSNHQSASSTNNEENLNNNLTAQNVNDHANSQFGSNSQGSRLVRDIDAKRTNISHKREAQVNARRPRKKVREESINENTSRFTSPEPYVGNGKAASSCTFQREKLISATRGSCASPDIVQSSLTVSQSSGYRTQTVTQQEYVTCGDSVTSVGTSERRSPIVSLLTSFH